MLFSRELSKFAFNLFLFNFPQNYKKKKFPTFSYKLHDNNYKICMKAFGPENILFEFDECVQTTTKWK